MDPLDTQYDQIAAGEAEAPRAYDDYKRMLARARRAARHGDQAERQAAVTVTAAIGGHWALGVLREFSQDEDAGIRKLMLAAAVAQGEAGVTLLRDLLTDDEPSLALEALSYLQRVLDTGSASRLRRLLAHGDPRMRAGAARLLGHTAGPGLLVPLQRARDDEEDTDVQAAIEEAIARIDGDLPRGASDPWWRTAPEQVWAPSEVAPLPAELPESPEALLALLGQVSEADQPPIVEILAEGGEKSLRTLVRGARSGSAPAGMRGLCVLAHRLGRRDWAVPIRRLLIDNDPSVRIAAADALAEIGPPAVAMNLRDLLSDEEPAVRLAALRSLRAVVPLDEALRYVYPLRDEAEPEILAELADMRKTVSLS
jgi:HEAT repeat protein